MLCLCKQEKRDRKSEQPSPSPKICPGTYFDCFFGNCKSDFSEKCYDCKQDFCDNHISNHRCGGNKITEDVPIEVITEAEVVPIEVITEAEVVPIELITKTEVVPSDEQEVIQDLSAEDAEQPRPENEDGLAVVVDLPVDNENENNEILEPEQWKALPKYCQSFFRSQRSLLANEAHAHTISEMEAALSKVLEAGTKLECNGLLLNPHKAVGIFSGMTCGEIVGNNIQRFSKGGLLCQLGGESNVTMTIGQSLAVYRDSHSNSPILNTYAFVGKFIIHFNINLITNHAEMFDCAGVTFHSQNPKAMLHFFDPMINGPEGFVRGDMDAVLSSIGRRTFCLQNLPLSIANESKIISYFSMHEKTVLQVPTSGLFLKENSRHEASQAKIARAALEKTEREKLEMQKQLEFSRKRTETRNNEFLALQRENELLKKEMLVKATPKNIGLKKRAAPNTWGRKKETEDDEDSVSSEDSADTDSVYVTPLVGKIGTPLVNEGGNRKGKKGGSSGSVGSCGSTFTTASARSFGSEPCRGSSETRTTVSIGSVGSVESVRPVKRSAPVLDCEEVDDIDLKIAQAKARLKLKKIEELEALLKEEADLDRPRESVPTAKKQKKSVAPEPSDDDNDSVEEVVPLPKHTSGGKKSTSKMYAGQSDSKMHTGYQTFMITQMMLQEQQYEQMEREQFQRQKQFEKQKWAKLMQHCGLTE